MLSESQFNALIEETFAALEQALDQVDDDLDYETSGGVLTVVPRDRFDLTAGLLATVTATVGP